MRTALIDTLTCPYCGGGLKLKRALRQDGADVVYGLAECRCFVFPIVEGILLLSLSKGYGGAEEALLPYVPLQAAAVEFLEQDRVEGLRDWMREHLPLTRMFLDDSAGTYVECSSRVAAHLAREVAAYLDEISRYGVLGNGIGRRRRWVRRIARRLKPLESGRAHELDQLTQFYAGRFFSPYVHSTMMQLGWLPLSGRVLSLCCGHGMFENLLRADGRATELVSIDGQFLNLLIARQFVHPQGQFICHDVQFGLPFADESFEAAFSSTCLPEIPSQRLFTREAIRVTRRSGWTWFDCIWNSESGGPRIARDRYYRFAQNFFDRLDDYVPFFEECARDRPVAIHVPGTAQAYVDAPPPWATASADIAEALATRSETQISALVGSPRQSQPSRLWLNPGLLGVSPVYETTRKGSELQLSRRPAFESLAATFAPKAFGSYVSEARLSDADLQDPAALLTGYCNGTLTLLPANFDRASARLARQQR